MNDDAAFKLDVGSRTLTMKHKRTGQTHVLSGLTGATTWYIHVNLHGAGDSAEVFPLHEQGFLKF